MKNKKPSKGCMGNVVEGLEGYFDSPSKKKKQSYEPSSNTDSNIRMEEPQTLKKVPPQKRQGPKK